MYLAIIILPLLGSIASGFFGRKTGVSGAQLFTCTAVVTTTILVVLALFEVGFNDNFMYYLVAILFILKKTKVISSQNFCNNLMVKPHSFATELLQSDMGIAEIVAEISTLLPQLANFIDQFNITVNQSGINVITDSIGTMSIDVPNNMSNDVANKVSTRIGVIDRLITTHGQNINDLLNKGTAIENQIKLENSNYQSQLVNKILEFKRLNALYKH